MLSLTDSISSVQEQVLDLIKGIGGIGVAAQHNFRPARANPLQHIQVPPGLDFYLDTAVTGSEFELNFVQQLLD